MKISKLKYVFAFVLLVAISVVSTKVQAATYGQIKLSTIIQSQLAVIEDGDEEPSKEILNNVVKTFNTAYNANVNGTSVSPVQNYSLIIKNQYAAMKAYSLTPGTINGDELEFKKEPGQYESTNIGLALVFGLGRLDYSVLQNQTTMSGADADDSMATQLYIWLAKSGLVGSSAESTALASLGAGVNAKYRNISNSVAQASLKPSYTSYNQNDAAAAPYEMRWNDANQRYEVNLTDDNALDTMPYVNLLLDSNGIVYTKNGNNITFYTTEQIGSASNPRTITVRKSINNGRYVAETASLADGSMDFVYLSDRTKADDSYYVSFYTNALRVKVTKTVEAVNGKTGDAKAQGARYGIYEDAACTKLVQEVTIGADGTAMTSPLEFKDYYVKEIAASEGCKVDTEVKTASAASATTDANGQKIATVGSTEKIICGGLRMIVSTSPDLSGNTTKVPSAGSKVKLTLDSNSAESYEATVDADGYAEFKNIPYGRYTLTETERPQVAGSDKVDLMDPMKIVIDREEEFIYSKIVNTEVAQRYVKIIKKDYDSKNLVTSTASKFQVRNAKGEIVQLVNMYPQRVEMREFSTADEKGNVYGYTVLPEKLPAGSYTVYETEAPYGYYNKGLVEGTTSATFTVEPNSADNYDRTEMVTCEVENEKQKAVMHAKVTGDVLVGLDVKGDISRPAYQSQVIPGAKFVLKAKEDIIDVADGSVVYKAGDTVKDDLVSDDNGEVSCELLLGSYTLTMTSAPEGYILDSTEKEFSAEYKGQTTKTYDLETQRFVLTRQQYKDNLQKVFEGLNFYKGEDDNVEAMAKDAYADVEIGIYAAEDIKNAFGTVVITKDTLVDVVKIDEEGKGSVTSDLPIGKFYAKELKTNENFKLTEEKFAFENKPENKTDELFTVEIGEIVNEAVKETKLTLLKIERTEEMNAYNKDWAKVVEEFLKGALNGALAGDKDTEIIQLDGAKYKVLYLDEDNTYKALLEKVDGKFEEVVRTTDENGNIVIEGLPFGQYAVQEVEAPRYYDISEEKYAVELTPANKEVLHVLPDDRTKVTAAMTVVDEDGVKLEGVKVSLIDADTKKVEKEVVTDENGVADFGTIRAGRYSRVIEELPEQYIAATDKEFYIEKDTENLETYEAKYITGFIQIIKKDEETGEPVPGCKFSIVDEDDNVVAEAVIGEDGTYTSEALRYGTYTVRETEAAENYEMTDDYAVVTIAKNGVVYSVEFTNLNTGDIAVALYAIVAMISAGAIVMTVRNLKRN